MLNILQKYSESETLEWGYYKLQKDGKWGIIDHKGNICMPYEYDEIQYDWVDSMDEINVVVRKGEKWGLFVIGFNNELVLPCEYDDVAVAFNTESQWIDVKKGGKWGRFQK